MAWIGLSQEQLDRYVRQTKAKQQVRPAVFQELQRQAAALASLGVVKVLCVDPYQKNHKLLDARVNQEGSPAVGTRLHVDATWLDEALLPEARRIFGESIVINDHEVHPSHAGKAGYFLATWQTADPSDAGSLEAPGFALQLGVSARGLSSVRRS